jgi:MFS family permease
VSDEARATERPATFREVFASREFRAVYTAYAFSWFGDYLAKAAVTALVFQRTESVALSATTFALTYLPWAVGGPVLAALADRYRYRTVMVVCDVLRMALIALVAIPGLPIPLMIGLLFLTALANPPAQAAKSALMPLMLTEDRLVVGLGLNTSTGQFATILGYAAGATMAPFVPWLALVIDAATFGVSALLIRLGVQDRPPATAPDRRRHLIRETADGFAMVFSTPVLRAIAILVFAAMLFSAVPEGLAAAWAADISSSNTERGLSQALIMAANPLGFVLGGLIVTRLVRPSRRQRLVRPFAILTPLSLVPAVFSPGAAGIAVMAAVCGFAVAGMMPTSNGLFVQALPHGYRARAFGVMQSGVQIMQGVAVLGTGLLSEVFTVPKVVGLWSLGGVLLMVVASAGWPSPRRFAAAIAAASRTHPPAEPAVAAAAAAERPAPQARPAPGRHRYREPADNGRATSPNLGPPAGPPPPDLAPPAGSPATGPSAGRPGVHYR